LEVGVVGLVEVSLFAAIYSTISQVPLIANNRNLTQAWVVCEEGSIVFRGIYYVSPKYLREVKKRVYVRFQKQPEAESFAPALYSLLLSFSLSPCMVYVCYLKVFSAFFL
jgi:hypothetical protein